MTESPKRTPVFQTVRGSEQVYSWDFLKTSLAEPMVLLDPMEIHLFRHGETETNARGLITGSQDVPLTPHGREQARLVSNRLDPQYDIAFHSGLVRSADTLGIALGSGNVQVPSVYADVRLNERSLGRLELEPIRTIEEFANGDFTYAPQGGDSYAEVTRRLLSFLFDLANRVGDMGSRRILICGHMGSMRILLGIIREMTDPIRVLAQSFRNTEVVRADWSHLRFPHFLHNSLADRRTTA